MWVWTLAGMHCNAWKEENTHLQIKRNTPTIKIMYINSQADLVSGNKLVHQRWHWRACVEARGPTYHGRNVSSTRRVLNYFSISSFSPLHFYFILSSFYSNLLYFPLFFQNNSSSHAWNVSPVLSHWLPDDWQMPPTLLKEGLATHARPSTPPVKAEGKKKQDQWIVIRLREKTKRTFLTVVGEEMGHARASPTPTAGIVRCRAEGIQNSLGIAGASISRGLQYSGREESNVKFKTREQHK